MALIKTPIIYNTSIPVMGKMSFAEKWDTPYNQNMNRVKALIKTCVEIERSTQDESDTK